MTSHRNSKRGKGAPDIEACGREYIAGSLTTRQLGAKYGVSHTAVQKWAAQRGWKRAMPERAPLVARVVAEPKKHGFVYLIAVEVESRRLVKIGKTANFFQRLGSHQTSSPFDLRVLACFFVADMDAEERGLHEFFAAKRVRGEWFDLSDDDLRLAAERALLL